MYVCLLLSKVCYIKEEHGQFGYHTQPKHMLLHWNRILHPDTCRIRTLFIWNLTLKFIITKCTMLQKCNWFCGIILYSLLMMKRCEIKILLQLLYSCLIGSVSEHRSLTPEFQSGHIWRAFHLWLRFVTFGGRSVHLAYHVHKSGHKTSIIIR